MAQEIDRRDLIKLAAGAAVVSKLGAAVQPRFFTPDEYLLVQELTEIIIPADEQSPGAKAAGVADYIDSRLAEAFLKTEGVSWKKGLVRVDALSRELYGNGFMQGTPAQRIGVVTRMAAHEDHPQALEELFFRDLKRFTVHGYYTSSIGIHDEMGYLGNTYQQGDYAGELPK
jgi:hypothetical protein